MMPRCIVRVLLACLAIIGAAGSANADNRLFIVTEDYPPYEMAEPQNGLRGFDHEVATEAFRRMGYGADIRFLPWVRALGEAERGAAVGVLTCAYTPERDRFLIYSDPISTFTEGFFVRYGHRGPSIATVSDVVGQRVASMAGYESFETLKNLNAGPVEVPTTKSGLFMLKADRFDYLHAGLEATRFIAREHGLSGEFRFIPTAIEDFHFCFSRAYPGVGELVDGFNTALADMRRDGTYDAIHAKYR